MYAPGDYLRESAEYTNCKNCLEEVMSDVVWITKNLVRWECPLCGWENEDDNF